jgi:hypothetical protein
MEKRYYFLEDRTAQSLVSNVVIEILEKTLDKNYLSFPDISDVEKRYVYEVREFIKDVVRAKSLDAYFISQGRSYGTIQIITPDERDALQAFDEINIFNEGPSCSPLDCYIALSKIEEIFETWSLKVSPEERRVIKKAVIFFKKMNDAASSSSPE